MQAVSDFKIDLFSANLPSLDEIKKLADWVNCSEITRLSFIEQLESKLSSTDKATSLAAGIGLAVLGRNTEAVEKLEKAADCKEKFIYLGYAYRGLRNFEQALKCLDSAGESGADQMGVRLEKAAVLRVARQFEKAAKELKGAAKLERVSADYHYQLARLEESQGLYEEAIENYKVALELQPNHPKAMFHLAYTCDLRGDEEAAVDYYKQITSQSPAYVSALLNLAVLYEDRADYEKASRCIETVLKFHPNHKRARLFKKDIDSSKTMVYDEEKEERLDKQTKLLETPISDFELSVRSRNCLKKMNIITIGDLLRTTESELLSYKNFGETSLVEIKKILETKNLRLGMAIENKNIQSVTPASAEGGVEPELLNKSVNDLELSVRARRCLQILNIKTVGDIIQKTEAELLGCKNFGVTSLNEIKQRLGNLGLSLHRLD